MLSGSFGMRQIPRGSSPGTASKSRGSSPFYGRSRTGCCGVLRSRLRRGGGRPFPPAEVGVARDHWDAARAQFLPGPTSSSRWLRGARGAGGDSICELTDEPAYVAPTSAVAAFAQLRFNPPSRKHREGRRLERACWMPHRVHRREAGPLARKAEPHARPGCRSEEERLQKNAALSSERGIEDQGPAERS